MQKIKENTLLLKWLTRSISLLNSFINIIGLAIYFRLVSNFCASEMKILEKQGKRGLHENMYCVTCHTVLKGERRRFRKSVSDRELIKAQNDVLDE